MIEYNKKQYLPIEDYAKSKRTTVQQIKALVSIGHVNSIRKWGKHLIELT